MATNKNALPKGTITDKCITVDCPNTAVRKKGQVPYCEECFLEVENEEQSLEQIKHGEIAIPVDVAMGYHSRRPELLKLAKRPMDAEEVGAILDLLAGEMRMREITQRMVNEANELAEAIRSELNYIEAACRDSRDALKEYEVTVEKLKGDTNG